MNDVKLRKLVSQWIDGAISEDDLAALRAELHRSEDARRNYLQMMAVNAELHNQADAKRYLGEMQLGVEVFRDEHAPHDRRSTPVSSPKRINFYVAAVAATALAASVLIMLGTELLSSKKAARQITADETVAEPVWLVEVESVSPDCSWYVEHAENSKPPGLRVGDIVRVTSGELGLKYTHGTTVSLAAPAAFEILSDMHSRMVLGHLVADVSEQAKGFSVETPRATVVDLGTKFSVNVENDTSTEVVVFQGEVDVDYRADSAPRPQIQRLQMGEAMRLDAAGTASRIVSITSRGYMAVGDAESSDAIITEVRDNIERNSVILNYYGIVHQGMQEDALAFVDREAHQWNGLDASGIPSYLVGGDYVMTFNNDKFNHDLRLSVKLARSAKLYVLFDDRLPVPRWLEEGFRDTGDNIGLDTGPFFSNGAWHNFGPPGVGPGESVEDTFSVWVKEVRQPGEVFLGSTEAPKSEPNMYGIVAVPLDSP